MYLADSIYRILTGMLLRDNRYVGLEVNNSGDESKRTTQTEYEAINRKRHKQATVDIICVELLPC